MIWVYNGTSAVAGLQWPESNPSGLLNQEPLATIDVPYVHLCTGNGGAVTGVDFAFVPLDAAFGFDALSLSAMHRIPQLRTVLYG